MMKRLVILILAAAMMLPCCAWATTTSEEAAVPAIGRDVVFTRGMEYVVRDIVLRTEGPVIKLKTTLVLRIITTNAYDQSQLSIAFCVDGKELIALWIEELPDGRGSITFKNSKYRSTIVPSVHEYLFKLMSPSYDTYADAHLQKLLKDMEDYVNSEEAIRNNYQSMTTTDSDIAYEYLGNGMISVKWSVMDDMELEATAELRSIVPESPLFDLSDLIPEPLDPESNPYITKDGEEVVQHDGTDWLLHDPAILDFYACLIPLLQEQKSDVPQYSESNFQAYMQKAEAGDAAAMYAVGYLYYYGQGTEQDADKALEWFEKAAEAGSGDGFGMLGYIYDVGEGVPEDPAKAFEYYQKAANLNSGFAIYNLAIMYLKGKYVEEDPEMAKELFIRSAQTGFDAAIEYVKETYPEEYQLLENAVGQ